MDEIRLLLDATEPRPGDRRAIALTPSATATDAIVEQILNVLARTALELWPVWFTDSDFSPFTRTVIGHEAARLHVRQVGATIQGLAQPWAEAAVALALDGRVPRVPGMHAAIELRQLCVTINREGVVLVLAPTTEAAAFVHAVEWVARTAAVPVIVTFEEAPDWESPFERLLHGVHTVVAAPVAPSDGMMNDEPVTAWMAPVTGRPHPLSQTEQRLAAALARDDELSTLFSFNQFVDTARGLRPKVDLLWPEGRLVIELDGYAEHGTRIAFRHDRHRDYELIMTGYAVLRLANDEIAEDIETAIDKIRDVVRLRKRSR